MGLGLVVLGAGVGLVRVVLLAGLGLWMGLGLMLVVRLVLVLRLRVGLWAELTHTLLSGRETCSFNQCRHFNLCVFESWEKNSPEAPPPPSPAPPHKTD